MQLLWLMKGGILLQSAIAQKSILTASYPRTKNPPLYIYIIDGDAKAIINILSKSSLPPHTEYQNIIATTFRSAWYDILFIDTSTEQLEYCEHSWTKKMSTSADSSWSIWFGTCSFISNGKARARQWCSDKGTGYCISYWSIKAGFCCECRGRMCWENNTHIITKTQERQDQTMRWIWKLWVCWTLVLLKPFHSSKNLSVPYGLLRTVSDLKSLPSPRAVMGNLLENLCFFFVLFS